MPTFQEAEEIRQAQVQSLLQAKAKFDAILATRAAAAKEALAEVSKSPFSVVQDEAHARTRDEPGGVALNPFGTLPSSTVVVKPPDPVSAEPNMLFTGIGFLVACALLYMLLRRMWD